MDKRSLGEESGMERESDETVSFKRDYRGVKALIESGITRVPDAFIISQLPRLRHEHKQGIVDTPQGSNSCLMSSPVQHGEIPVIDLEELAGKARAKIVKNIGEACDKWGFFQVINHGVPSSVILNMIQVSHDFFELPTEEKMEFFSADTLKPARFGTSYNLLKDAVLEWRDYLRCPAMPLSDFIHLWPSKPLNFREITATYASEIAALAKRIYYAISESLGLEPERLFEENSMEQQIVTLNHYPACPSPDLTIGLSAHSDAATLTVLYQDEVGGLEVFNEGQWIRVKPLPDAFVINLGDQTQLLTNGRYKSVQHRASVNSERERISVATFFNPALDVRITAVPELLNGQPQVYRDSVFKEYITTFHANRLNGKSLVESLKRRE